MTESKLKGWYITPDGERVAMPDPANEDGTYSLAQMQEAVGGMIQEVVGVIPGKVVLVDEEGLLKGLPLNPAASVICRQGIVGNALIMNEDMWS